MSACDASSRSLYSWLPGHPLVVAHRGNSVKAPENTLAAFREAIELGAPAAECDVHLTRDGQVVVMHDATLDRTTDGTGGIAGLTLAEVQAADAGSWKGDKYRGEHAPTLADTLALTRGKLRLLVEIKAEGIARQVVEVIRRADALADVTVISFSQATCKAVRELEPRLPVGLLSGGIEEDSEDAADALIRAALGPHVQFLSVAYPGAKPSLLRRAQLAGMSVFVWTIDDPEQVQRYASMGVASITSNDPAMAMRVVAGL